MIGYSDSGKQVGYVPSNVALFRAQEDLARAAAESGVLLTIFHGRGGAIGRGGGPANRTLRAQPPGALGGRLRMTDQGETIATRYGRREIARRDLEQMINAVLVTSLAERRPAPAEEQAARRSTTERAASAARNAYARLLADPGRLAGYALAATPMQLLAELPIASRPAARRPGLSLEELRAIPWVFSWNQSRHGIPGWYGLGSALEAIREADGPEVARRLYAEWPFFRALVDNAQLALARADIEVAEWYSRLADDETRGLFEVIRAEHDLTVSRILEVTGEPAILSAQPTIAGTVKRRNPYVDVLSHAQIELLKRLRAAGPGEGERIREVLFITINGIAAGLQTAG
jgi:phosphoenolpyruvate carboxylase